MRSSLYLLFIECYLLVFVSHSINDDLLQCQGTLQWTIQVSHLAKWLKRISLLFFECYLLVCGVSHRNNDMTSFNAKGSYGEQFKSPIWESEFHQLWIYWILSPKLNCKVSYNIVKQLKRVRNLTMRNDIIFIFISLLVLFVNTLHLPLPPNYQSTYKNLHCTISYHIYVACLEKTQFIKKGISWIETWIKKCVMTLLKVMFGILYICNVN
jgi:hypothetical protein